MANEEVPDADPGELKQGGQVVTAECFCSWEGGLSEEVTLELKTNL